MFRRRFGRTDRLGRARKKCSSHRTRCASRGVTWAQATQRTAPKEDSRYLLSKEDSMMKKVRAVLLTVVAVGAFSYGLSELVNPSVAVMAVNGCCQSAH